MTIYRDQSYDLAVQYDAHGFELTDERKQRFEEDLDRLATIVGKAPATTLHVELVRHPRRDDFHVKTCLRFANARTFFTGERDRLLSPAFKRCVHKLIRKVERFRGQFEKRHPTAAERGPRVTAAIEPPWSALTKSVAEGEYGAFRNAIAVYEDTLALRVGRAIERFPAAAALLGEQLVIGEIVEEVFLLAFEEFAQAAPSKATLGEWLDGLIEPAVKALLTDPVTEKENIAFARAVT